MKSTYFTYNLIAVILAIEYHKAYKSYNRELEEQGRKSEVENAKAALANSDEGIPEFDKVFSDKKWSDHGNGKKKFLKFKGETEGPLNLLSSFAIYSICCF